MVFNTSKCIISSQKYSSKLIYGVAYHEQHSDERYNAFFFFKFPSATSMVISAIFSQIAYITQVLQTQQSTMVLLLQSRQSHTKCKVSVC